MFSFIRDGSMPFLRPPAEPASVEADRAAQLLYRDYRRFSRWLLGTCTFVVGALAALVVSGMSIVLIDVGQPIGGVLFVLVVALAVLAASLLILVRLWRSGRLLTRALAQWLRVPLRTGGRIPNAAGWFDARLVNFQPLIMLRLVTASLAFLIAIAGITVFIRNLIQGGGELTAWSLYLGLACALAGAGQTSGVLRIVNAKAEADPIWLRLRRSRHGG